MGIRQALSQAHRPQGNGRAEVAGKTLKGVLAKMHTTQSINWVEALPRAVMVHNTTPRAGHKYTPYQILFGREWSDGSLPYTPIGECCEEGEEYRGKSTMWKCLLEVPWKRNIKLKKKDGTRDWRADLSTSQEIGCGHCEFHGQTRTH